MNLRNYLMIKLARMVPVQGAYQENFDVRDNYNPANTYNRLIKDRFHDLEDKLVNDLSKSKTLNAGTPYSKEQAAQMAAGLYRHMQGTGRYLNHVSQTARTMHNMDRVIKPHLLNDRNRAVATIPIEVLSRDDIDNNAMYNQAGGRTLAAYNPIWHKMIVGEDVPLDSLPYLSAHEYGHFDDYSSPKTKARAARLDTGRYHGNDTVTIHGKQYTANELSYLTELEASKRGYQAIVNATSNAPKKIRNKLRNGARADMYRNAQDYAKILNLPVDPRYAGPIPQANTRNSARSLQQLANINGVNTKKELDIQSLDREYFDDNQKHTMLDMINREGMNLRGNNTVFSNGAFAASIPVLQDAIRIEKSKRRNEERKAREARRNAKNTIM